MADKLQQLIQQLMQKGNTYGQSQQQQGKSDWEKTLAQMAMAQKMDAGTMGGFAAGKLLRGAFDTWKNNYNARGKINADMLKATPEERAKKFQELQQGNPNQAERTLKFLNKHGIDTSGLSPQAGNVGEMPPADGGEINSDATARLAQQAFGADLPPEGSNLTQQALTQGAANFDFNSLPEVAQPFAALAGGEDSPFSKAVLEAAQSGALGGKDFFSMLAGLFGR